MAFMYLIKGTWYKRLYIFVGGMHCKLDFRWIPFGITMGINYSIWRLVTHCYMAPNSSSPPFGFALNARMLSETMQRIDTMPCVVATHICNTFWAKATFWKNLKGTNHLYTGLIECTFCTPIKSNASPHLATGSGFVNWSALWDVVLIYNNFIISSHLL